MKAQPEATAVLLDCTLRDGSYAVNFQFTRRDTRRLCQFLESAGISYIEVGHGLGLGASSANYGIAFENDVDYLEAAAETLHEAQWGVFFIPGIGSTDDLRIGIDHGIGFVRIGAEVEDFRQIRPFADQAHEAGVMVCANLMKTYAVGPQRIAEIATEIQRWGNVDCIYLVDSAGCMTPGEVQDYVTAMGNHTDTAIGFHGHNNLDLANANCLAAIEAGAQFVDGSICGIGRSAGNAQTEVLAFLLNRGRYAQPIDYFALFEAGETVIRPLNVASQGLPPLDIVIGMARFHTSHMKRFRRVAEQYSVDVRRLILAVSVIDCVNPSGELIEQIAKDLARMEPT